MKVCFWHTRFHPIYSGQVVQIDLIRRTLKSLGYETAAADGGNGDPLEMLIWTLRWDAAAPEHEVHEGVTVRRFGPPGPEKWKYYARHLNILRATVTERNAYDILQFEGINHLSRFAILPIWLLGKKSLVHMTLLGSDDPFSLSKGPYPRLYRFLLERVDGWISMSTALTEAYHQFGLRPERLHDIPIAVACAQFSAPEDKKAVRRALGLPEDRPILVSVGHVIRRKGYDRLMLVAEKVLETHPDALFLFVGPTEVQDASEEPLGEWIQARIQEKGLQNHIRLTGRTRQVDAYMQASDIFVFATRREGFGIVAMEAAATELPVVMFELPGISGDLVDEGQTGHVVPDDDLDAMASRLRKLLDEPALRTRMGQAGRARALGRFEVKKVARQYMDLYRTLVHPGN